MSERSAPPTLAGLLPVLVPRLLPMLMVAVESPAPSGASGDPHCEQKRAASGFALPQLVQYGIGDRLLSEPSAEG
jgi:hypothetical protein